MTTENKIMVSDVLRNISNVAIRPAKEYDESQDLAFLKAGKISVRLLKRTCSALSINSFQKSNYALLALLQTQAKAILNLIESGDLPDSIVTKGKGLKSKKLTANALNVELPKSLSDKVEAKAKALENIEKQHLTH